jgi:tetratricopeptide (TPR) repeat protein
MPEPAAPLAAPTPAIPAPRPLPRLGLSADRLNQQAKVHFDAQRFDECARLSREALEREPWNTVAWGNLANALFRLGQAEESLRAFDRAFACDSVRVEQWASRAAVEQLSGRKSEALRSCREFLALAGPGQRAFVPAIEKQARALEAEGVRPAPRLASGLVHEGVSHGAAGRLREAVSSFERALAVDPRLVPAWTGKVEALVQLREPEAAARTIDEALKALPEDPRVWHRKGILLATRRRFV